MSSVSVGITMGDPSGIGPEIVVKAMNEPSVQKQGTMVVVGDFDVLREAARISKHNPPFNRLQEWPPENPEPGTVYVLDRDNVDPDSLKRGSVQAASGRAAFDYIKTGTRLAMEEHLDALVTAPINKQSLKAGGVNYIGHTEMLADLTQTKDPLTMYQVESLRIFFLTRHVSLRRACEMVTQSRLERCIRRSHGALERLGMESPKLAVAALNPHGSDEGLFGHEEREEIQPAVRSMEAGPIDVEGPIPADSVFHFALQGEYDGVVGLYHDQGQMAAKMVDFHRTISVTNNLPFIRTSVDHGTAFDIAGTGQARPDSLIEAIHAAVDYAPSYNRSRDGGRFNRPDTG